MDSVQHAVNTQLMNIEKKTGKSLNILKSEILAAGLTKHGEVRQWVISTYHLGYGDANALALYGLKAEDNSETKSILAVVDEIYTGNRSGLRPIHDAVVAYIDTLGEYEISPKKGYVSLRRKKQFAMVTPATSTRVDLGLNAKDLPPHPRLLEQPKGGMCNYIVKLADTSEFNDHVKDWLSQAYLAAG